MFKVGDHIVYPMYGAGVITDVVEKDFLGEARTYYNVSLPYCRMEASVPVDNSEKLGVRHIIKPERIEEVFGVLKDETERMNPNWNKRYRENTERMQTGDILEVAAVIRNLILQDRRKRISGGEKRLLDLARQIFLSELSYALAGSVEQAEEWLMEQIDKKDN